VEDIMAVGIVKWFDPKRGFGFIEPRNGGDDVLIHISTLNEAGLRSLDDGLKVSFDLEAGNHGEASAVNIKIG
jgi:CspA family cold shock protein